MTILSPRLMTRTLSALVIAPVTLVFMVYHPLTCLGVMIPCYLLSLYEWGGMVVKTPRGQTAMAVFGGVYITLCFAAFLFVRFMDETGWLNAILVLMWVWLSDTGAYLVGRALGGPKLIPAISPNKTWAGLWGAMLFPAVATLIFLTGAEVPVDTLTWDDALLLIQSLVIGAVVGGVAQAGDLMISVFKRRAGVKDTGALIPGHGGILDRIDALLLVSLVAALASAAGFLF